MFEKVVSYFILDETLPELKYGFYNVFIYFGWMRKGWKGEIRMEFLSRYVVVVVLAICLCLGYVIKHSISFIPNKYIPLIMAVVGTILNVWINGWTFTPEILLGGLASGLASTGTYEMVRNIANKSVDQEAPQLSTNELKRRILRK